jgi:lipid-A-disaccharide synthase-like uncharacterized protein
MNWLRDLFIIDGSLFRIEWNTLKIVGMTGNLVFFSRFWVQWFATERRRQVVVPVAFWWLSLIGSGLLLAYAAFYRKDSVFTLAYVFTWIPYIRNLVIHRRAVAAALPCPGCHEVCPTGSRYCHACGTPLHSPAQPTSTTAG